LAGMARPTIFVIVGDHAPPFSDTASRSQFSSAEVPYVLLLPRVHSQNDTQIAGDTNFIPGTAVTARVASGASNPACQIQYGDGITHSTPAVCP
jgi:phosphoglycerol transferase MdoB-like AlkP superfamily enzyme